MAENIVEMSERPPSLSIWRNYLAPSIELSAEWNYKVGVLEADLVAAGSLVGHKVISPSATTGLIFVVGWNYLDALYAIITGMNQLLDEENYRQTQTKVKGMLNILSGVQMLALSYNPLLGLAATTLAAPSFAFAMMCDFVNAGIDLFNAYREVHFESWLAEKKKELDYLDKRIADPKNKTKLPELQQKKTELLADIKSRSRVYHDAGATAAEKDRRRLLIQTTMGTHFTSEFTSLPSALDRERDKTIQAALNQQYRNAKTNFIFKGLSFVGMGLLAIAPFLACPPLVFAGLAIVSLVAAYYLAKNPPKVLRSGISLGKTVHTRLFKSKPSKAQDISPAEGYKKVQ